MIKPAVKCLVIFAAVLLITGCSVAERLDTVEEDQVEIVDEFIFMVQCSETSKRVKGAVVSFCGETAITGLEGMARFENIEAGRYIVEIAAEGFLEYSFDNVVVIATQKLSRVSLQPTKKYSIIYHFTSAASQIWMPVPVYWDGYGTIDLDAVVINPEPNSLYTDEHGNLIAYFYNGSGANMKYSLEFVIEVSKIKHDLAGYATDYDQSSEIYLLYTAPERYTQSDDPRIISLAEEITAGAADPVEKAKLIAGWVRSNIVPGDAPYGWLPDAISVLQYKKGHCGAYANMFVALSRAVGIPARNVSVFHNPFGDDFESGKHSKTFYGHIIAEFYLENYGWVQVETSMNRVGVVPYDLIILSKGNTFTLEKSNFGKKHLWFHLPERGTNGQVEDTQMEVERLY